MRLSEQFQKDFFPENGESSISCQLHEYLDIDGHNCLGCNLNDQLWILYKTIQAVENISCTGDSMIKFQNILINCYLIVERVDEILRICKLPDEVKHKRFQNFKLIRSWANFIKHPKSYILVHHPHYIDYEVDRSDKTITYVDSDFVREYYSGSDNNKELQKLLKKNENVLLIIPPIDYIIKVFHQDFLKFLAIVEQNEIYREILSNEATLIKHFDEQL